MDFACCRRGKIVQRRFTVKLYRFIDFLELLVRPDTGELRYPVVPGIKAESLKIVP